MRIVVAQPPARDQRADLLQRGDDRAVGVAFGSLVIHHAPAGEDADIGKVAAVGIDGERHLDAVFGAELEVVLAVAGRDVHEAGTGVLGDEVARQHGHGK